MILSDVLNYTNPAPSGHWKPNKGKPAKTKGSRPKERKTSFGAFLQPLPGAPSIPNKKEIDLRDISLLGRFWAECKLCFKGIGFVSEAFVKYTIMGSCFNVKSMVFNGS